MNGTDGTYLELKIAVLNELSAAMRHQSQAEYVYTAAAVAGYGAICLGVATLPTTMPKEFLAGAAAVFILALSVAIGAAIQYNHDKYEKIRDTRKGIAASLAGMTEEAIIPDAWTNPGSADGVLRAYGILGVSTLGTVAFCAIRAFGL